MVLQNYQNLIEMIYIVAFGGGFLGIQPCSKNSSEDAVAVKRIHLQYNFLYIRVSNVRDGTFLSRDKGTMGKALFP